MKLLLIVLCFTVVFLPLSIPFIVRAAARTRADQIIYGQRTSTEKNINTCITILTWTNKWITNQTEQDSQRIYRFNLMLEEMRKPHG